jgi:hypothetical protein
MTSFYNILSDSIKRNYTTQPRSYYESVIAKWSLNGWLTDTEVANLLTLLDQLYVTTEPQA